MPSGRRWNLDQTLGFSNWRFLPSPPPQVPREVFSSATVLRAGGSHRPRLLISETIQAKLGDVVVVNWMTDSESDSPFDAQDTRPAHLTADAEWTPLPKDESS